MRNIIGTYTQEGLGIELGALGALNQPLRPTANSVVFVPFTLTECSTVYKLAFMNCVAGMSGNVDVGIYDDTGCLITHTGSTPVIATVGSQVIPIPKTKLDAGNYYFAFVSDSASIFVYSTGINSEPDLTAVGIRYQTATFPLPLTATWLAPTGITTLYMPHVSAALSPHVM